MFWGGKERRWGKAVIGAISLLHVGPQPTEERKYAFAYFGLLTPNDAKYVDDWS